MGVQRGEYLPKDLRPWLKWTLFDSWAIVQIANSEHLVRCINVWWETSSQTKQIKISQFLTQSKNHHIGQALMVRGPSDQDYYVGLIHFFSDLEDIKLNIKLVETIQEASLQLGESDRTQELLWPDSFPEVPTFVRLYRDYTEKNKPINVLKEPGWPVGISAISIPDLPGNLRPILNLEDYSLEAIPHNIQCYKAIVKIFSKFPTDNISKFINRLLYNKLHEIFQTDNTKLIFKSLEKFVLDYSEVASLNLEEKAFLLQLSEPSISFDEANETLLQDKQKLNEASRVSTEVSTNMSEEFCPRWLTPRSAR